MRRTFLVVLILVTTFSFVFGGNLGVKNIIGEWKVYDTKTKLEKGFIKLEIQGDSLVLFQEDNFGNWRKDETVPIKPTKVGPKGIEFSKTFYNDVDTMRTIHKIEFTDFKKNTSTFSYSIKTEPSVDSLSLYSKFNIWYTGGFVVKK